MMNEGFYQEEDKIVGKKYVGNKLCMPNQIELSQTVLHGRTSWVFRVGRFLYTAGIHLITRAVPPPLFQLSPTRYKSVTEFLELEQSQIVVILRHPNAVIHSIQKRGGKSLKEARRRWSRSVEITDTIVERHPERVFVTRFESLVTNPESTLRRICEFLEVDYFERMTEGMAYNPIGSEYDKGEIDSSRAHKETPNYNVWKLLPEVSAKYDRLVEEKLR